MGLINFQAAAESFHLEKFALHWSNEFQLRDSPFILISGAAPLARQNSTDFFPVKTI